MMALSNVVYFLMTSLHMIYEFANYLLVLSISATLILVSLYLFVTSAIMKKYPVIVVWPITIVLLLTAGGLFGYKNGVRVENNRWEVLASNQRREFNQKLADLNSSISATIVNYKKTKENLLQNKVSLEGKLAEANLKLAHSPEMDTVSAILHDEGGNALTSNTIEKLTPDQPVKVETKIKYVKVDIPKNYCQSKTVPSSIRELIVGSGQ